MSERDNTIMRVEKNKNFVVMDKTFLQDAQLSWKAKGIMAYMLSLPDDWRFYLTELQEHSTDGEKAFRSGFKELTDAGYVKRFPVRKGRRIERWETVVYENPLLAGFVHVQKLQVQNDVLLNNNCTKNNNTKQTPLVDSNELFEEWWGVYRKKVDKKKCSAKYKTLLKTHKHQEMMAGTKRYFDHLEGLKKRGEFSPNPKNPLTFLNGENFNDEYETVGQTVHVPTAKPTPFKLDLTAGEG